MYLSQVVALPFEAAVLPVIVREKAVDPTTEWTWLETCPGEVIGSLRCWVRGAQLTVHTELAVVVQRQAASAAMKMLWFIVLMSDWKE